MNTKHRLRTLLVGGTFGNNPTVSKISEEIFLPIKNLIDTDVTKYNGGRFSDLEHIVRDIKTNEYDIVVWLANVPEEHEKIVRDIKINSPTSLLVTSKRNLDGKYNFQDIIYHALGLKSNLMLEIYRSSNVRYGCRLLDPLGNCFEDTEDFTRIGTALSKRLNQLLMLTRLPSKQIGKIRKIPVENEFLDIIRKHADSGFPSFKKDNLIYVTKRNIDKREIDKNAFVPVKSTLKNCVEYYGQYKPSVDTPIQILLYDYYKNARYMLHSHTYVLGGEFTRKVIPCGNIEEADEVIRTVRSKQAVNFGINLLGHGSIIISDNLEFMKSIEFMARSQPEMVRI